MGRHLPDAAYALLFHPLLYPGTGPGIRISQEELGYLAGASRQRVNQALHVLEKARLVKVDFSLITILDLEGLRSFESRAANTCAMVAGRMQ